MGSRGGCSQQVERRQSKLPVRDKEHKGLRGKNFQKTTLLPQRKEVLKTQR